MKVYFDARMIDHPGIGRYIRCLLPFIHSSKDIDLYLLGNRDKIKKLSGIEGKVIDFDHPIYSIQEQLGFLMIRNMIKDDILHVPHYNIPVLGGFNLVSTIHDLIHMIYPAGASGRMAPLYMRFMINRILKSARGVICVSQATRDELGKMLLKKKWDSPLRGQSLFFQVIHEGVDKVFTKISDSAYLKNIKDKYGLPDKFILYVGSIRRHKNIEGLLDSFERLNKKAPEMQLVMVGRYSQQIDLNRKNVFYLGEVAGDADLAGIYNLASCLLNLSLYEGFGLTILEAQKCGLPIVCSDIPPHREIGGEGIAAVKASYIDQIDENLYNVLFNNDIRDTLVSKGFKNADRFSWQSAALKTINIYRKIRDEGSDSSRLASGNARRGKDPQCFLQNISTG